MSQSKFKKESITVMVPAYNEEKYLESTVSMVNSILKELFNDFEILIFDDCSSDRTGEIADALSKKNPKIRVIHNEKNRGLGYNYRVGAQIARKQYYCFIAADIDTSPSSIKRILGRIGSSDFIISYMIKDTRPLYRRVISRGFTILLNILFGQNIRYYCGPSVYKTKFLRNVRMSTNSFAMNAEVVVQLLKLGKSYLQVPYDCTAKGRTKESNIFRLKNMLGVLKTIGSLYFNNLLS